MSDQAKQEFEQRLSEAVAASLGSVRPTDELRGRLLERLSAERVSSVPGSEESVQQFERRLAEVVKASQQLAPPDSLVLRVESALGRELGHNVMSERSAAALLEGEDQPEGPPLESGKFRFLNSLRAECRRANEQITAPDSVRRSVLAALDRASTKPADNLVVFPGRSVWKKSLSALTSLAAGFAIVLFTLFGSADVALANSVRSDHRNCCKRALTAPPSPPSTLENALESRYGAVPVPPVDSTWQLRVSKMCMAENGQPMLHLLYTRPNEKGETTSMSLHFLPLDRSNQNNKYRLKDEGVQVLDEREGFPVVAWTEGDWLCTACSPELSGEELRSAVRGL